MRPEQVQQRPIAGGRTVVVEGRGEMFVRDIPPAAGMGGSSTIVLLHGWTLSADLNWFTGVYDVAGRHGRVLAPDLRGHGRGVRTDEPFALEAVADDVIGLIRACDAAPVVVVGYSLGGSVALLCAARAPELVAGVVLASTDLRWRHGLPDRLEWLVLTGGSYVLRFGPPWRLVDWYLRHAVRRSPALAPYLDWMKAEIRRGDGRAIGRAVKALARFDGNDLAAGIDQPAAVVVTTRDRLVRPRRQRAVAESLDAPVIEVEGGHSAWLILAQEWAAAIDEGIERVTSSLPSARDARSCPARSGRGKRRSGACASSRAE